jgi:hypothetical protein
VCIAASNRVESRTPPQRDNKRNRPGKPTQNGRHERKHLTLKETTKPAANNFLQQ